MQNAKFEVGGRKNITTRYHPSFINLFASLAFTTNTNLLSIDAIFLGRDQRGGARDFLPELMTDWSNLASKMLGDVIGRIPRASRWTYLW